VRSSPEPWRQAVPCSSWARPSPTAVAHGRRNRRRPPAQLDRRVDESWSSSDALEGFPMEGVRPWPPQGDTPDLNRLYLAWILAEHGHETDWITAYLDLAQPLARLLVDAAHARP
jgi:hypothetical protein